MPRQVDVLLDACPEVNEAAGADPADAGERLGKVVAVRRKSMRPRGQTPRMLLVAGPDLAVRSHFLKVNEAAGADPADATTRCSV